MAALGLIGLAGPASAAPANIPDQTGSVTVHKFQLPDTGALPPNASGVAVDAETLEDLIALNGVVFSIQQVTSLDGTTPLDLTTTQGWDAINPGGVPLTAASLPGTATLVDVDSDVTAVDGSLVFADLPIGLYLVTETDSSGAETIDGDRVDVVNAAVPFLVSIPMPLGPSLWNFDVHAYPKNATGQATKTVDTSGHFAVGDDVTWTITAGVPHLAAGKTFTEFSISDQIPVEVAYADHAVTLTDADGEPVTLTEDVDYEVAVTGDEGDETVVLTLLAPGLAILDGAQGGSVAFDITTTILSSNDDGTIVNGTDERPALVTINDATIPVTSQFDLGGIHIVKHVAGNQASVLDGAEFSLYASAADAVAGTNAIVVDGQSVWTSGPDDFAPGQILIDGIKPGTYYLKEIKAPAGYVGTADPIAVVVAAGGIADAAVTYVGNTQQPPVVMPPLGAAGVAAAGVLGAGLLVAGGLLMARNRAARSES